MKHILKIFLLYVIFVHAECKGDTVPVIKIEFSALIESRVPRPLFISSRKLNFKLDSSELHDYETLGNFHITRQDFINIHYNLVLTNKSTFRTISKYIKNQYQYYQNSNTHAGFLVTITGEKSFFVPYGPSDKFFNDMTEYLKSKHCDKQVINELLKLQSYNYL